MSNKQIIRTLDDLLRGLEALRSHIMDLEAMAHAAAEALEHLPYLPRLPHQPHSKGHTAVPAVPTVSDDTRRNMGRMQSMVVATAAAATRVLEEIETIVDRLEAMRPAVESNDNDAGNTGAHEPRLRYGNRSVHLVNDGASTTRTPSPTYGLPGHAARRRLAS